MRELERSLTLLLAIAVLLVFWTQQRYPALLHKLDAGTAIRVSGTLSYDALLKTDASMTAVSRIARTTVNWLYTNRYGMYFAVPFGAALMTLLAGSATPRRFSSAASNVLCGAVAGAPLGVCTNCATPVAQSMLVGGASTRMTLAAMISSPSFNPVVVAMAFVLFPFALAMLRMLVPLALLVTLPLIVPESKAAARLGMQMPEQVLPVATRLRRLLLLYGRNVLRLLLLTAPWMLLAAVAGAIGAELIPRYGTHLPVSAWGVALVALLGTLLPVPMALDVSLAYVLFHAGVPVAYVAALLCTLGPVSIYSLSALARQLGRGVSLRLAGLTAGLGFCAGLVMLYGRFN